MSLPPTGDRYSGNESAESLNALSKMEPVKEPHLVPPKPPGHLPIILQVLLYQPHRLRALILLSQFGDLGPWAVHLVLTIESLLARLESCSFHVPPLTPDRSTTRSRVGSRESTMSPSPFLVPPPPSPAIRPETSTFVQPASKYRSAPPSLRSSYDAPHQSPADSMAYNVIEALVEADGEAANVFAQKNRNFSDLIANYPLLGQARNLQQLLIVLRATQPRHYSIASSPLVDPRVARLCVGVEDLRIAGAQGRDVVRARDVVIITEGRHPVQAAVSPMDPNNSIILRLGMGVGMADVLPLRSTFFDWCSEYFAEPQMRQAEADEPGSIQFNDVHFHTTRVKPPASSMAYNVIEALVEEDMERLSARRRSRTGRGHHDGGSQAEADEPGSIQFKCQVWRQNRNENVLDETGRQSEIAETRRWDRPVTTLHVPGHHLTMAFHAFHKHLFVANESDVASVLRLYRNYDPTVDQGPVQMVSAFRALNELVTVKQGAYIVMDWKQSAGIDLVGGDSRIIRVWDAQTEIPTLTDYDLNTNSESHVTAIVCDAGPWQIFTASFANGEVKGYDRRMDEWNSVIRTYVEHESWVQNVPCHPTVNSQFLSASLDRKVKLWDLRGPDVAAMTWNVCPQGLSAFTVIPQPVFSLPSAISQKSWKKQTHNSSAFESKSRRVELQPVDRLDGLTVSRPVTSFHPSLKFLYIPPDGNTGRG
ncbi:hypothetical protein C8R43DRAFT_949961 [Mycena crocata]|nr:hypothetical protein C8R43DRAFT_949961 [Mycena crocata]